MTENDNKPEAGFELEDIEDAKIIIKAKGKHWSVISNYDKISREEAAEYRKALAIALIGMQEFIIVTPALEDIDPAYAKKLIELKSLGSSDKIAKLVKKYEGHVSNIEWHIKTNQPAGAALDECNKQLFFYNEMLKDLKQLLPEEKLPPDQNGLVDELKRSEIY